MLTKRPLLAGFCLKAYFEKSAEHSSTKPATHRITPMTSEAHRPAHPSPLSDASDTQR